MIFAAYFPINVNVVLFSMKVAFHRWTQRKTKLQTILSIRDTVPSSLYILTTLYSHKKIFNDTFPQRSNRPLLPVRGNFVEKH